MKRKAAKKSPAPTPHHYLGIRVLIHVRLPDAIVQGIRERAEATTRKYYAEWDRAARWFLVRPPQGQGLGLYAPALSKSGSYKTLWISKDLVEKLRQIAERDEVSLARVVHTLGLLYVQTPTTEIDRVLAEGSKQRTRRSAGRSKS